MQTWRFVRRLTVTTAVFGVLGVAVVTGPPQDTVGGDEQAVPTPSPSSLPEPTPTTSRTADPAPAIPDAREAEPAAPGPTATAPAPQRDERAAGRSHARKPTLRTIALPAVAPAQRRTIARGSEIVAEVERDDVPAFSMVGVTWQADSGAEDVVVQVRTRKDGAWSGWTSAPVETGDGVEGTDGIWVGESDGVAARFASSNGVVPEDLAIAVVDPGEDPQVPEAEAYVDPEEIVVPDDVAEDPDTVSPSDPDHAEALNLVAATSDGSPAFTPQPTIISRAGWGAAAQDRCSAPQVSRRTVGVVLHHTAGSNSYTKAQSASIVRSAQKYHMDGLGWCDIGYNFLVDKYGQIFEGRAGGANKMVRGAHAGVSYFNENMVGVSMMGNYETAKLTSALQNSVVKLIGWRLATHYVPALGTFRLDGRTYHRILGHRDVKATACPGRYGYAWLNQDGGLRDRVAAYISKYSTPVKRYREELGFARTGYVYLGETRGANGYRTIFDKMELYFRNGAARAFAVGNGILTKYAALGRQSGVLGFPRSWYLYRSGGFYQRFEHGTLYQRTRASSAYALYGTAADLYYALGEYKSRLGYPTSSLTKVSGTIYRARLSSGRLELDTATGTARAYDTSGKQVAARAGSSTTKPSTGQPKPAATTANQVTVKGSTLPIYGRGYGHGIGMSQYGAYYAAKRGRTWQQILAYYYPGTTVGTKAVYIRVRIDADTTTDVQVRAEAGLKLRKYANGSVRTLPTSVGGKPIDRWRLVPRSGRTEVQYALRGGGWTRYGSTTYSGVLQFEGTKDGTITLVLPGGATKQYRGAMRSVSSDTVNYLPIDYYLRGVVPAEMPTSWHGQAVRAQAVAARTYAVRSMSASRYYDVCDTTSCQVYGGTAVETARGENAVRGTTAKILTYRGTPALTQFSSSTGGRQAAGSQPYLQAKADSYDNWPTNPNHTWSTKVSVAALQKLAPAVGTLKSVKVTARAHGGTWGGRATKVMLTGSKGSQTLTADKVRFGLGLKSTWFAFTR